MCSYAMQIYLTVHPRRNFCLKGYVTEAPPTWSEPSREPAKNIWSEREQFVNEALPQNREEEEEMLRVALEMSKLQEQEDNLRRQM